MDDEVALANLLSLLEACEKRHLNTVFWVTLSPGLWSFGRCCTEGVSHEEERKDAVDNVRQYKVHSINGVTRTIAHWFKSFMSIRYLLSLFVVTILYIFFKYWVVSIENEGLDTCGWQRGVGNLSTLLWSRRRWCRDRHRRRWRRRWQFYPQQMGFQHMGWFFFKIPNHI